jgi:hypothetical protein
MNRKIYLLLTVLLAWSFNLKAQTAQIESVTANPGTVVSFDIDVAGLPTNVGAVSLFIGYDPNVLTYVGSAPGDPEFAGYFINNMTGSSQVGIQWTNPYGADINGTLLTLNFQYSTLGGTCDLTFDAGCEFTDIDLNPVAVSFSNGSIGPNAGIATITIDELLETAGPVTFNVTGAGFDQNAGALTLNIAFDPSVLTFTSYTSTLTGLSLNGNNTTGMVSIAYSSTTGESLNVNFLDLNFIYDGTGPSELIFTGDNEVAYLDLSIPVVSFDNGLIEPLASAYSLTIGDVVTTPGGTVNIPITAAGYNPTLMGAVTLYIGYNPAHLDFLNVSNGTITGINANMISAGLVGITWSNGNGALIDGTLLTMNFDYNFGSSEITFEGGCEVADMNLQPVPTTYLDGSIAPVLGGPEISLPTTTGTVGETIDFPITAKNFLMDVGAISLFIGYDDNVLSYTGHTPGTLTNYFINNMVATSQVGIQWTDLAGLDIDPNNDDVILTLHFTYNGGEAPLTFDAGCDFAQPDLTFIPVAYYDGAVITGTLFNIKAYLEGPYNSANDTMSTLLNEGGFLPLAHPYSIAPWNYSGTESVDAIPNTDIVDWVLVEIRETTGDASTATSDSVVARKAAFILKNGSVVDIDGESEVLIPTAFEDNIYVVVYHRNHVYMMSATALPMVAGIYTYDFTTAQSQAYGNGQKALTSGFAMYAADGNGDGQVSNIDLFNVWIIQVGSLGYYGGDFDLNTQVQNADLFNYWIINVGSGEQVP